MKNSCSTLLQRRDKKKKKIEAVPKSLQSSSASSSIVGDDAEPQYQPLWVALWYYDISPLFCSIVQLDPLTPEMIKNAQQKIYAKYVAHFKEAPGLPGFNWTVSPPLSSTHDLYLLPAWHRTICEKYDPLHGATFNCSTKSFQAIEKPNSCRVGGITVTVRNHIYFMAHPVWSVEAQLKDTAAFERYNPANQSWEPLEPFPRADIFRLAFKAVVKAFAVWDDTILLNIGCCEIWAYNVSTEKWYHVNVKEDNLWCYNFIEQAFAIGNTIYALSGNNFNVVLALSIEKNNVPGDGNSDIKYTCSFKSLFSVPPVGRFKFKDRCGSTRSLVDLGNNNICFVQSCQYFGPVKTQPIHVTHIKIMEEGKMAVTSQCLYRVELVGKQFRMGICFSPPDCKTAALKPCETFIFNPLLGTEPEVEDKIGLNTIHDAGIKEKENVDRPKKGCSVIVINFPPDATAKQLDKSLNKFGHLKRIRLIRDTAEKCFCAIVKFETRTSTRRAIKASPIRIGVCRADILELRGTFFSKVGSSISTTSKNHKRKR